MLYTCDACHCPVDLDRGFFRSVNLRAVAWCRDCWFERHSELGIPAQRRASERERVSSALERAQRRWLSRR